MKSSFKSTCVALREKGHTLQEIVDITGRSKTTVYFHIRNLPLSPEREAQRRYLAGVRIREFAIARTGKSERVYKPFATWTPDLVMLVAHLLFDGEIQKNGCAYNNRSEALLQRVEDFMRLVYEFEPKRYTNKLTGVKRIAYHNVALGAYFSGKSQELTRQITSMPKEMKRSFLKAFFDDEGCMDFNMKGNRKRVRGYQKDTRILELISGLLTDFNIDSRVIMPNEVTIVGKPNLMRFQKEIGFSPGVRINGNRSNSVWKEHLEKRELLQRAIDSYRT